MGLGAGEPSPGDRGRVPFEVHCAQCHGVSGQGGYLGPAARAPAIAGTAVATTTRSVREGSAEMPPLSAAVLPDAALGDLGIYVHEALLHPTGEPGHADCWLTAENLMLAACKPAWGRVR